MTMATQHSKYWLDADLFNDDDAADSEQLDINRIARLAAVRRAIANFVSILSGKNVPVEYSSGKRSYTDGNTVVISAEDNPEKFDVMVGLALHEGSHVLLSDFSFLKGIVNISTELRAGRIPSYWSTGDALRGDGSTGFSQKVFRHPDMYSSVLPSVFPEALLKILPAQPVYPMLGDNAAYIAYNTAPYWAMATTMINHLKDIMNILEDRRIDKYVYQNAQGYRPYYDALYAKYFFTSETSRNLKFNPAWREITIDNYINRLLLSFHPHASPDAMPGLRQLIQQMDLSTIERVAPVAEPVHMTKVPTFDETPVLWQDACALYTTILQYASLAIQQNTAPEPRPNSLEEALKNLQMDSDLPNLDGGRMEPVPVDKDVKGKGAKQVEVEGKFNEKKGMKELAEAKKVMDGTPKKKSLKQAEKDAVDALETADAEMVDIKGDGIVAGKCMVLRKMTTALFEQEWFIFSRRMWAQQNQQVEAAIAAGRRMGALLHHRLQVRNDPMMTKQTRLPQGGMDRRLLAQLGMDITNVFQKSRVDIHKPVILHLSLDGSGSMAGAKWHKVITVATAVAYMSAKLPNVEAVISVRGGNDMPLVAILYDSRKDTFTSFLNTIRRISPAGATPEGLAFKATLDLVLENVSSHDVYFINFSDGEPSFSWTVGSGANKRYQTYGGEFAANHTKAQIRAMRDAGVKILSYFIQDGDYINPTAKRYFNIMYGADASFVNVKNAGEVLRTLNKLLLNRGA